MQDTNTHIESIAKRPEGTIERGIHRIFGHFVEANCPVEIFGLVNPGFATGGNQYLPGFGTLRLCARPCCSVKFASIDGFRRKKDRPMSHIGNHLRCTSGERLSTSFGGPVI